MRASLTWDPIFRFLSVLLVHQSNAALKSCHQLTAYTRQCCKCCWQATCELSVCPWMKYTLQKYRVEFLIKFGH